MAFVRRLLQYRPKSIAECEGPSTGLFHVALCIEIQVWMVQRLPRQQPLSRIPSVEICVGLASTSGLQSPAQSPRDGAAGPYKLELSRALAEGSRRLKARLKILKSPSRACKPRHWKSGPVVHVQMRLGETDLNSGTTNRIYRVRGIG